MAFRPGPQIITIQDIENLFETTVDNDAFADVLSFVPTGEFEGPPTDAPAPWGGTSLPTNINSNRLNAWGFPIAKRSRYDLLRCYHDAAATGTMIFALYRDNGFYPGALVAESVVTVVGHAVNHLHDVAVDITLNAGLYWMACLVSVRGAGSWGLVNFGNVARLRKGYRGVDISVGSIATVRLAYDGAQAAPMPDPFPAGFSASAADNIPAFYLRKIAP